MKKYTYRERQELKKQAKSISEAFNEDLDQIITHALDDYIIKRQKMILKRFLDEKKKKIADVTKPMANQDVNAPTQADQGEA